MTFVSDLILMSIATCSNQQQLITGRFGRVGLSTACRNCSGTQLTNAYAAEMSCNLIVSDMYMLVKIALLVVTT